MIAIDEGWKYRALGRLLSKIDNSNGTGCWEWQGGKTKSGYGMFFYGTFDGKEKMGKAHKAAWTLIRGPVPDGLFVLHRCHNNKCCNPDHLYLGTHMDNMKDRDEAGRTSRGAHRYNFKRDEELVGEIGKLREQGLLIDAICKCLGIGKSTYYRAARAGAVDPEANKRARSANASAWQAARKAA